jgi:DNA repair exonuclease SbcCD ATPase subunit
LRAAIKRLRLNGTGREIEFSPGLNVIRGEIGTGKSTVLRLIYGLFGGGYDDLIPELRSVASIEGQIILGDSEFRIVRRPVSTLNAPVEIDGSGESLRLPADEGIGFEEESYKHWVQRKLGLPELEVWHSERLDVEPSPVTIKDYFFYSYLRQTDIGSSLLGSADRFRSQKRRAVFSAVWGLVSARYQELESELRRIERRLFDIQTELRAAENILRDTEWSNGAALIGAVERANASLDAVRRSGASAVRTALLRGFASGVTGVPLDEFRGQNAAIADGEAEPSRVEILRNHVLRLDEAIALSRDAIAQEQTAAQELETLAIQLDSQRRRLSKARIAGGQLLDYDFLLCPRCGTQLDDARRHIGGSDGQGECYLCLQVPEGSPMVSAETLVREEARLRAQIQESRELSSAHEEQALALEKELATKRVERVELAGELDARTRAYVSDEAANLETRAATEARLRAEIEKLREFMKIHERLDRYRLEEASLVESANTIAQRIRDEHGRMGDTERNLEVLDGEFRAAVEALNVPRLDPSEYVAVDRDPDYLGPVVWGRRFDQLHSPGAKSLVNVAFAAANQRASVRLQKPLVNVLLIDGLTNQIGDDPPDRERKHRVWDYLAQTADEFKGSLQIIVADNEVPDDVAQFVRVSLSSDNRLVPLPAGRSQRHA